MIEAVATETPGLQTSRTEALTMARVLGVLATTLESPPDDSTAGLIARLAAPLGIACPPGVTRDALTRDFAALFAVPGPHYVAPYESVYCDAPERPPGAGTVPTPRAGQHSRTRMGTLMGPSTLEVQQAQHAACLAVERGLPDHIANEVWFVAHLWKRQAEGPIGSADWAQQRERFTRDHLQRWLDILTDEVRHHETCGVYSTALTIVQQLTAFND